MPLVALLVSVPYVTGPTLELTVAHSSFRHQLLLLLLLLRLIIRLGESLGNLIEFQAVLGRTTGGGDERLHWLDFSLQLTHLW